MAKVIVPIISVGLLVLLAAGCGPSISPYVGNWIGYRNVPPGDNPMLAKALSKIELAVKDDGSFELHDAGMRMNGRLSAAGEGFTLDVQTLLNHKVAADFKKPSVTQKDGVLSYHAGQESVELQRKRS